MTRYWYDSFPGVDFSDWVHVVLDPYKTPYTGNDKEAWDFGHGPDDFPIDDWWSVHAPYTTVSQNRGGIA